MKAKLTIHPSFPIGEISPRLYGVFLEPIGNMVNGSMFNPKHPAAGAPVRFFARLRTQDGG